MEFETFWKPFERIYQILCVSHYSIYRPDLSNSFIKRFLLFIYFIFYSSLHIALIIYATNRGLYIEVNPNVEFKRSPFMHYVNFMSTMGNVASHFTSHLEALCMAKNEKRLLQKFEEINAIFIKLNCKMNYERIRKRYLQRTITYFTFITMMSVGSSFFSLSHTTTNKYTFLFIRFYAVTTIRSRGCYIALMLKNLAEFLENLQKSLDRHQQNCRRNWNELPETRCPMENIRHYRDIYTKLWIVKNLISDCFGWTLITFITQFTLDLINLSYWIYMNSTMIESTRITFRKYFDKSFKLKAAKVMASKVMQ